MSLDQLAGETLEGIRDRGTYRRMRILSGAQSARMVVEGQEVALFAGSNYLDLAHHPEVVEASARAARDYGCASGTGLRDLVMDDEAHRRRVRSRPPIRLVGSATGATPPGKRASSTDSFFDGGASRSRDASWEAASRRSTSAARAITTASGTGPGSKFSATAF